jgi:hypothetical protein
MAVKHPLRLSTVPVEILCDVEYVESTAGRNSTTRTEKAVPLYRLTVKSCPWHEVQLQNQVNETRRQSTRQHHQSIIPPLGTKEDKPLKTSQSVRYGEGRERRVRREMRQRRKYRKICGRQFSVSHCQCRH